MVVVVFLPGAVVPLVLLVLVDGVLVLVLLVGGGGRGREVVLGRLVGLVRLVPVKLERGRRDLGLVELVLGGGGGIHERTYC